MSSSRVVSGEQGQGQFEDQTARLAAFYESLSPQTVQHLADLYDAQAQFKDPFNEVKGVPAIAAIFQHMFDALESPRFVVNETVAQGEQALLTWTFYFHTRTGRRTRAWEIHGASHIRWGASGKVVLHRDYWDAAEELYEKLPVLGGLMRFLKRRLGTPQA